MSKILIALGGNALLSSKDRRDFKTQVEHAYVALDSISDVIHREDVVITHGNGPQVGDILLRNQDQDGMPPGMPLHACGAMSQGLIGEIILEAYERVKREKGLSKDMSVIVTRTVVNSEDLGFKDPSKPVGEFFTEKEAKKYEIEKGWKFVRTERGFRRVVPSPFPVDILEKRVIESNLLSGLLPVCVGGGGIPVVRTEQGYEGVDAVIDKDLASAVLAYLLEFDQFIILTDVTNVYVDYGKERQRALEKVRVSEMEKYVKEGQFARGSMGPKVQAALEFLRHGGKTAKIGKLENAMDVLNGRSGTEILPD